ncbi:hypothetical protein ACLI1X_16780, partial [Enterococcus faecalis]
MEEVLVHNRFLSVNVFHSFDLRIFCGVAANQGLREAMRHAISERSEQPRGGQEGLVVCRYPWSPGHYKGGGVG